MVADTPDAGQGGLRGARAQGDRPAAVGAAPPVAGEARRRLRDADAAVRHLCKASMPAVMISVRSIQIVPPFPLQM